jgi:hypothetical protein
MNRKRSRINLEKAGPRYPRAFMKLALLEGPAGEKVRSHEEIAAALVLVLRKSMRSERDYIYEFLSSVGMKSVSDSFRALLTSDQLSYSSIRTYTYLACDLFSEKNKSRPEKAEETTAGEVQTVLRPWQIDFQQKLSELSIPQTKIDLIVDYRYMGPRSVAYLEILVNEFGKEEAARIVMQEYELLSWSKRHFNARLETLKNPVPEKTPKEDTQAQAEQKKQREQAAMQEINDILDKLAHSGREKAAFTPATFLEIAFSPCYKKEYETSSYAAELTFAEFILRRLKTYIAQGNEESVLLGAFQYYSKWFAKPMTEKEFTCNMESKVNRLHIMVGWSKLWNALYELGTTGTSRNEIVIAAYRSGRKEGINQTNTKLMELQKIHGERSKELVNRLGKRIVSLTLEQIQSEIKSGDIHE